MTHSKYHFLSLKKVTSENIDSMISDRESRIKGIIAENSFLSDNSETESLGESLINLAALKDARFMMASARYKAYENSGKEISFEEFSTEWENSL